MREIQTSALKAHRARLPDEVEAGETLLIKRHGRPIARLVPEPARRQAEIDRAIGDIRELQKRPGRIGLEQLLSARHEGHKY